MNRKDMMKLTGRLRNKKWYEQLKKLRRNNKKKLITKLKLRVYILFKAFKKIKDMETQLESEK